MSEPSGVTTGPGFAPPSATSAPPQSGGSSAPPAYPPALGPYPPPPPAPGGYAPPPDVYPPAGGLAYPPPQGPAYGPALLAPSGPAGPGAGSSLAPGDSAAGLSARRLLVLAAVVGLLAGLLGGAAAYLVGSRIAAPRVSSPLPAPLPGATTRPEGSIARTAAQALPSVVTIRVRGSGGSGTGSGFVIDGNGHILTNNHVIASASSSGSVTLDLSDGTSLRATLVGRDSSYDLAVLKAERTDLPALQFGRSADVVVGDGVIAVGAPLGLEATVTSGIVSALDRPVAAGGGEEPTSFINAIQTDAAINPGNSGGPLLDLGGRVIGVNSAIARAPGSGSGNIGLGFAIPSDQAVKTAQQLISTGRAVHPVIGVRLDQQYDGSGAKLLDNGGVGSGSPAAAAGLQDGDVIVGFEGRPVTEANQLIVAIRARSVGDTVRLKVERGGRPLEVTLTLQAAPAG